ncbi:MAG: hypothetical protein Q8L68_05045, partial [Methylococcales bacterium]|nr:hypothetical protein [Methylococcales bacterium]
MPKFSDLPADIIQAIAGKPYTTNLPKDQVVFADKSSSKSLTDASQSLRRILLPKTKMSQALLLAVAYGMESQKANKPVMPNDVRELFKCHLFAKDLLQKSPEFLLERAHVTDWAGRTFIGRITIEHPEGEGITAFEYALWAKDFKMIEMMLQCLNEAKISVEVREQIRSELSRQYEQVRMPISLGGGLTYL